MAYVIALAGKGGTGKTSIAALAVRYLMLRGRGPVLAVDADANSCLNEALGIAVHATIGGLREESLSAIRGAPSHGGPSASRPGGMSMEQLFDYQVQQSIIEAKGYDLMVMGRPEGPGCYCAANNVIRKYTDKLSENYPYVVIDNEAGMEHLSRRTTHRVNLLLIVSDPTVKGLRTAKRIETLVEELSLEVDRKAVLINRVRAIDMDKQTGAGGLNSYASGLGLSVAGLIPEDENISEFDMHGRPVMELPQDSPAVISVSAILDSFDIP